MLSEPFKCAARRKDQPRFAVAVTAKHLRRADPLGAGAFALDHSRLPVAGLAARNEEQRIEAAHRVEFGYPARERCQGSRIELQTVLTEQFLQRTVCV